MIKKKSIDVIFWLIILTFFLTSFQCNAAFKNSDSVQHQMILQKRYFKMVQCHLKQNLLFEKKEERGEYE